MSEIKPLTILCLASHFKGAAFMQAAKKLGCTVLVIAREAEADEPWPRESIDEMFFMPDLRKRPDILYAVSYIARSHAIDQVIALDDFDVETAGALRDHLRLPGMGETQARHFRDKLAMRMLTQAAGIPVPEFTPVFNYDRLRAFMERVPPPWLLKPRSEASAMGIMTINHADEIWPALDRLGDEQSFHLLERFVPGDVFHVDGLVQDGELIFAEAHRYGRPPMSVYQGGGVFVTRTLERDAPAYKSLVALNRKVLKALSGAAKSSPAVLRGATHVEYIRSHADGKFYFLECASRVGGANIAEMVEFATGINLWAEWVKIEAAYLLGEPYQLPEARRDYAGVMNCLSRQDYPDLSGYADPEVAWRMQKKHHAGLILASPDSGRLQALLDDYSRRFGEDFLAVMPPQEKAL
jgi:biotin carboxylase